MAKKMVAGGESVLGTHESEERACDDACKSVRWQKETVRDR